MLLEASGRLPGKLWRVTSKPISTNSYVVQAGESGKCFLIDPGIQVELIEDILTANSMEPTHIFCTHGHFDHIGGANYFQKKYHSVVYLPRLDVRVAKSSNFLMMALKIKGKIVVPEFDELIEYPFQLSIGGYQLEYISCPGHTMGSSVISVGDLLFTGDSLYAEGVHFSSLPEANLETLRNSLLQLLDNVPRDSWILPGHGVDGRLGNVINANIPLREFLGLP